MRKGGEINGSGRGRGSDECSGGGGGDKCSPCEGPCQSRRRSRTMRGGCCKSERRPKPGTSSRQDSFPGTDFPLAGSAYSYTTPRNVVLDSSYRHAKAVSSVEAFPKCPNPQQGYEQAGTTKRLTRVMYWEGTSVPLRPCVMFMHEWMEKPGRNVCI